MFRSLNIQCSIVVVLLMVSSGCRPKPEPVAKPELTPEISFADGTDVVSETDVNTIKETGRVEADLNLDGYPDLVLMRTTDDNTGEVEVFLQKPTPVQVDGVAPMVQENQYIRVGTIQCKPGARITGIASRKRERFTDLIVLVGLSGQAPLMVHYLNDGNGFKEQAY